MIRISIFLATFALSEICASAVVVDATPGNLSTLLGDQADATTLTVNGSIDATDLEFIASMKSLDSVDLSKVEIVAHDGSRLASGNYTAAANTIPAYSLFGATASSVILPDGITKIGEGAFGASAIKSIDIPATVMEIGSNAFAGCTYLSSVNIPSTVVTLGNRLFSGCSALTDVDIQAAVDSIGSSMFANCTSLTDIILPSSTTVISPEAFINCRSLKSLTFPGSLKEIGCRAFYGSGLTSIDLSRQQGVVIGDFAFADCGNLLNAKFGENAEFGEGAFFNDAAMTSVTLPSSTTVIPSFTFKGASSLSPDEAVPSSVTRIGDYALTGWENTSEIYLPANLEYIGDNAMEGWSSITTIHASTNKSVPELGENVWLNVDQPNAIVYVSEPLKEAFENAPQWKEFNIVLQPTGVENIENDLKGKSDVVFTFEDDDLVISSKGAEITDTVIYDIDGRRRYAASSAANTVRVNTGGWTTGVIVAAVTLADGSAATVKLIRI